MDDELDALTEIPDLMDRVERAHELVGLYASRSTEAARIRREGIEQLLAATQVKPADIAARLNVSRQRVHQLIKQGPRPERAFLGRGDKLTVVVGGKTEGDKSKPGPVVSTDDLGAYALVTDTASELGFSTTYEVVQPPGFVDLSREGLVVACGPRLSPLIEQALKADDAVSFEQDADGWHLHDHVTNTVYRSPMDTGDDVDFGYVARLPRIDGRGTYLYSAGIHAPGVSGGLHYVVNNLSELYEQLKTHRFSMIVRCEFDQQTRKILRSERVTDLYRPDQSRGTST